MNVRELILNMTLWVRQSSPKFAMLRQSSHEGARMLPVYPGICLTKTLKKKNSGKPNLPPKSFLCGPHLFRQKLETNLASHWEGVRLPRTYTHNCRAIRCKMGRYTDVPVRNSVPKGGIAPFWELLTSLKRYRAIWGIAAIVSQYRAIWGL